MLLDDIIRYFPPFASLSEEDKNSFKLLSSFESVEKGTLLLDAETSACENIVIVKEGRLRVYSELESGRTINLYHLNDGEVCPVAAARNLYNFNIRLKIVADRDSLIIKIPASLFMEAEKKYPSVSLYSRRLFADRFSDILFSLNEKAFKSDEDVIRNFIVEEAAHYDGFVYKSQSEIEKETAVSRSQISSILNRLKNAGAIEISRRVIKVKDLSLLLSERDA